MPFVLSLTLAAALLAPSPRAQESPLLAERARRVDELVAAEIANGHHAGISFVLFHRDRLIAEGAAGLADVDSGRPMRRDTIVRVYSMTKPVTAVAALTLVEQGRLRLDEPIGVHLPELAAPVVFTGGTADAPTTAPAARAITVRMLLTHTAGFTYDFFRESPLHEIYRRAELWAASSSADFLARAAKLPLLTQPGSAWNYSIADDVLGVLIERVARQSLAEYVREHVTGPLGMVDTDFDVPPAKRARLAALHRRENGALVTMAPPFGVHEEAGRGFDAGGAGLFSTLDDFARFGRFLVGDGSLDGNRVLARKTLELARRDSLRDGQRTSRAGDGWCLIAGVIADPGASSDLLSQGTLFWNGAGTTTFFADPVEQLVGVLFAQHQPFDEHRLIGRFRTAVYQALR